MTQVELRAGRSSLKNFERAQAEIKGYGCEILSGEIGQLHSTLIAEGEPQAVAQLRNTAHLGRFFGFNVHEKRPR